MNQSKRDYSNIHASRIRYAGRHAYVTAGVERVVLSGHTVKTTKDGYTSLSNVHREDDDEVLRDLPDFDVQS